MQEWTGFVPCWSIALLHLRHTQDGATQVDIPRNLLRMQVLLRLICIVTKTMKFIKLHKTHSMAMVYKAVSVNANAYGNKLMNLRSKSKLQYAKINKNIKMAMPFDKSNNAVRNKPLKPNVLYANQQ